MKILTGSCVLRGPTLDDAPSLAAHANNRNVLLNLRDAFPSPYMEEDARSWIKATPSEGPLRNFIIDVDGQACGSIGFKVGYDVERVSAELGYWIGEPFWGRGIMTGAVKAITKYGFEELKLTRIFAVPMIHNPASFRVLEKAGFVREGIMKKAALKDGRIRDMVLYARVTQ
jgi:ribosomal-protein-alanine N-acetyltransferase